MPNDSNIVQYRGRLTKLSYPEYALSHADDIQPKDGSSGLNLSIWNDDLPPGVTNVALRALPKAVGSYALAQDGALIALLAKKLGIAEDSIIITAGADDALRVVSQYCIRAGTPILIPTPSFGRYTYHAMVHEAKIHYLPFETYPYELDIVKISEEVHQRRVECLFIASPNNPTGHALSRESIKRLLDTVSCSVILDESLLLATDGMGSAELVNQNHNLFICGSFSKLYAMPGLRIGWLVANQSHARRLRKLVSPFGVDALALEIAKHVMTQDDWLRERISVITNGITVLRGLDSAQLRVTHSSAPVALVEYTGELGSLYQLLHDRGVLTVAGNEFPGLMRTNAVRVIIKSVKDILELKRTLANLL